MTSIGLTLHVPRRRVLFRRMVLALAERWQRARRRREMRRYIMEMDERTLNDIGVSRAQALFEIDRGDRHDG